MSYREYQGLQIHLVFLAASYTGSDRISTGLIIFRNIECRRKKMFCNDIEIL
jgi:hypothetical protein